MSVCMTVNISSDRAAEQNHTNKIHMGNQLTENNIFTQKYINKVFGHSSSDRTLVQQAWGPEFNSQYWQKKIH
jgi:isochorismate hydrolase